MNANSDGIADIGVVQTDTSTIDYYCNSSAATFPGPAIRHADQAAVLLLVGHLPGLNHAEVLTHDAPVADRRWVELFRNNRTIILAQASIASSVNLPIAITSLFPKHVFDSSSINTVTGDTLFLAPKYLFYVVLPFCSILCFVCCPSN